MAKVIKLNPGQSPPEGEDWVMVTRRDNVEGSGSVRHGMGATFYTPKFAKAEDFLIEIERARTWADEHGVANVYVLDEG